MIAWFARNHVAANLLLMAIVLAGVYSVVKLIPLEVFPSFQAEVVTIRVSQRAATPEDMETGVAARIEEAVADLQGIKRLTSRSGEQSTVVTVELTSDVDPQQMLNEIKSRVDALSTLPAEAERPVVERPVYKHEVLSLVVAGDLTETELSQVARRVRDDLVRQPGITQTDIEGVRPYEIGIEISEQTLREYNLRLADVSQAIQGQALDLSAGRVRSDAGEILLRAKAQAYRYNEFASLVIKRFDDGSVLRLGDIADIDDGFEEDPIITRYNSQLAAVVNVYRTGTESAIGVSEAVHQYLDNNRKRYPDTVTIGIWDDDSRVVRLRLQTLLTNAAQGAILVMILLSLFLRPVVAFWVVVGIPVCFLGALALMPTMGVSLNVLSLFGFILVLGIVVDDAIVTGENIYTHYRRDPDGLTAAINGTQEVAVPVIFGILTTAVAFVPMLTMEGRMGVHAGQIGSVVIPVLMFSMIESKLILPAHLKHLRAAPQQNESTFSRYQRRIADGLEKAILRYYQPLLKVAMARRYVTVLCFVGITVITIAMLSYGWTRYVYFPRIPSETAVAKLVMQEGTPLATTESAIEQIELAAFELQRRYTDPDTGKSVIENVLSTVGATGGNSSGQSDVGRVRFEVTPAELRTVEVNVGKIVREWRDMIGPIAGAEELTYRAEFGRSRDPIDVQLTSDDLQALAAVTEQVKSKLMEYDGVFDMSDSLSDGKLELMIQLKPEAELLGFNLQQVTLQVREAFFGNQTQRIQRGRDDIRVMVRYPEAERTSLADLDELLLTSASGAEVRFADVASVQWGRSAAVIEHVDRLRSVNITADIDKTRVNMTVLGADLDAYLQVLVNRYASVSYSLEGEAAEQRDSESEILWGLLGVLFAIYALLAIPFASYSQPFIVMSVIPFSLVGAVFGHWVTGIDLSMMSTLGMLALVGIVVNDSLVLVDYINKRVRDDGMELMVAVSTAGVARFRPVLLTSLTTFVGLLPLLFEKSTQAQFLIPMAASLGFGILFGTFITLLMVPCNYLIKEDISRLLRGRKPVEASWPEVKTLVPEAAAEKTTELV